MVSFNQLVVTWLQFSIRSFITRSSNLRFVSSGMSFGLWEGNRSARTREEHANSAQKACGI